jgi:hypothetical protein
MTERKGFCSYLAELVTDYRSKLDDQDLDWLHPLIAEELYKQETKLRNIKEADLCAHYQQERISRSISQRTNYAF